MVNRHMGSSVDHLLAEVDRMLDPTDGNVTLTPLQRAAAVVGRRVQVALV